MANAFPTTIPATDKGKVRSRAAATQIITKDFCDTMETLDIA